MMSNNLESFDAVVIGGGFYGATIAIYLAKQRAFERVLVLEQESTLMQRASFSNQARVHNGYHYPRSFTTAYRSRFNLPRFLKDWPDAVYSDFTNLYALAKKNSKVTPKQFVRFCKEIGAELQSPSAELKGLFNPYLVDEVFEVKEYCFDSCKLAEWALWSLEENKIDSRFNKKVTSIKRTAGSKLCVEFGDDSGNTKAVHSDYVFNCTYSGLNQLGGHFPRTQTKLKHEITEMGLIEVPEALKSLGITIMDGPFFSVMPFPAKKLHTISHVRYTPHQQWQDSSKLDPYSKIANYRKESRVNRILKDSCRYVPALSDSVHHESLFEVKTILEKNEVDDGRPILFEKHAAMPRCYSILGGKIDNIYDVFEKLDQEEFTEI